MRISKASNRAALLRELKHEKFAFVFISSDGCGASSTVRPAFAKVAHTYADHALFLQTGSSYDFFRGETSPTILFVREGQLVHELRGLALPDGRGSSQIRAKLAYEAFVTAVLFGIDVSKDLRVPAEARTISKRTKTWLHNFEMNGPLDLSNRVLKDLVSFNSGLWFADFRGSDLRGAQILYSDLRGARFDGAKTTLVDWTGSICPDGHLVRERTDTCEGHLTPQPPRTWSD